ncbi:aminoacyl-tRNA deacylase [Reinekea marinisedimentorum]|uniref:Cys-tRNA(Pro)/Cys-tRNA(Cys) deacylase n=1 Tax=Reinekea marinisedimentorum TaxID=230495 RepID=A0A4R3IE23_9GAMM|nr:aminoacyl-tRNA deacylase [Reinekea marinisedimentorum]TCS44007.1 Cys-tRNA(Pro)/Cys-tRNA(Cys) deacylase [Reinekea marinisedimentorum]
MTPACRFLKQQKAEFNVHSYDVAYGDPAKGSHQNYGQAVADSVGISHDQLFKTLVICLNGDAKKPAICVVPASGTLNLKLAAKAFNAKSAAMAETDLAEKATGYVVGGISPFGQRKRLPIAFDNSALRFDTIFTSGGKRGLQIEFAPSLLTQLVAAKAAELTA